jgi:hypothetical protein
MNYRFNLKIRFRMNCNREQSLSTDFGNYDCGNYDGGPPRRCCRCEPFLSALGAIPSTTALGSDQPMHPSSWASWISFTCSTI